MKEPTIITIGGLPGSGKSAITQRLSIDLRIPRLGSDTLGRKIMASPVIQGRSINAYWLAYELLFHLSDEFLQSSLSVIVDKTFGSQFQWDAIRQLQHKHPRACYIPIILRCSWETFVHRIQKRHEMRPDYYSPPDYFQTDPKVADIRQYLEHLKELEIHFVDAEGSFETTYQIIRIIITTSTQISCRYKYCVR